MFLLFYVVNAILWSPKTDKLNMSKYIIVSSMNKKQRINHRSITELKKKSLSQFITHDLNKYISDTFGVKKKKFKFINLVCDEKKACTFTN